MKFVRWLGAFGKAESLSEAGTWELSQVERQVCAEPLYKGRSLLSNAKIGLEVAHPEATFARGWLRDAYTVSQAHGLMVATRARTCEFKNMNRFLKTWNKEVRTSHGEVTFNAPLYASVVVKADSTARCKRRAQRLAESLKLPLRTL